MSSPSGTMQDRAQAPAPTAPPDSADAPSRATGGIVAVLAFAGIVVAVMQTLLVPVVAQLPALLHTSSSNATWAMTATLLSGAVATPIMGRLGDLYGKRRMLLASLALMVIGSLIAGFTSQLGVMVVGRALQGFAMGAIPLGISIMRDELPRERLGSAMGLMSSSIGIGGGLGLPGAALLAQHYDWHVLFFTSAGLGVFSMLLTVLVVPESQLRAPGRFDVLGSIGLSVGLVALLLPITKGSDWGWGSPTTLGLFGAAIVVLLGWGVLELRIADPLVDLRTTARRQVLLTNLAAIMIGVSFYAMSLVLPELLELPTATGYGLGKSLVIAGLCMAPMGVAMMLVSPISARITAARGPKTSLMLGLLVIAIGYGAGLGLMDSAWQVIVTATVIGAGIGFGYSALPALIIGAVPPSATGAANGLNTLMRSIGTSVSSAVVGMVLADQTTLFHGAPLPNMHGFRFSFLIACAAVLLGLLLAAFLPGTPRRAGSHRRAGTAGEPVLPEELPELPTEAEALATAAPPTVHGRVLDPEGLPLLGATVTLVDAQGRQLDRAAAADGGFRLTAAVPGPHVLIGAADGHQPQALSLPPTGSGDAPTLLDLHLERAAVPLVAVRGTVRDRAGRPLQDAQVALVDPQGALVAAAQTAEDGRYAFPEVPGGAEYTVVASGYAPVATTVAVSGEGRDGFDLALSHRSHVDSL
jgi:MFS family permease